MAKFTLFRSKLDLLTSKIAFYFHYFLSLILFSTPTLIFPSLFILSLRDPSLIGLERVFESISLFVHVLSCAKSGTTTLLLRRFSSNLYLPPNLVLG